MNQRNIRFIREDYVNKCNLLFLFVCILLGEEKYEQKNKKRIYVPYTFIYSIIIS